MEGVGKALTSQFGTAECRLLPCPGWDCGALFPSATLTLEGNWHAGDATAAPALLIAHLLAGGPCFFLRCQSNPGQPPRPWVQLHGLLTSENRTGVLRTAGRAGSEVMLVPLMAAAAGGGPPQPIFAGFAASLLAGDFVKELLLTMRLPLVFDLDETLLVAKSQSQMAKELKALRDVRRPHLHRATSDPQQALKLAALDREEQLMQEDLALLQQFAEGDAVTYQGQRLAAQVESAHGDDMGLIRRPVIRLPGNEDTLLTRIEPGNPHSSMVFKLRPNWRAIWGYLGGLMDPRTHQPVSSSPPSAKLRFETYVCTAAERGYALEAWRVLDPDGWMMPPAERQRRLHSGSKQKSLGAVLQLGRGPPPGPGGAPASPMPLAVIVDDRVEIWDATNRGQVLQVEPFRPWEEQAAQDLGLADTPTTQSLGAQMIRLKEELFNLRSHAFHRVQEVLRRQLELLRQQPLSLSAPLHVAYAAALAPPPWVESLMAAGMHRVAQPEALPASLQAAMERPVDPRQLRRQQQQAQQQAQQQQAAPQQALPPGQPLPLAELSGQAGVELLASLQGLLGLQPPGQQAQQVQQQQGMAPQLGAVPVDPRQHQHQQHLQQQQAMQQPPPQAMQQQQPQQPQAMQPQRPQRQRPGKMAGPAAGPEAAAPGPGVALLQQQAAADPRRRPGLPAAGGVAAANAGTLSEVLGMLPSTAALPQQPGMAGRARPPPMVKRLVGLHGPAPRGQQQQQPQQQQQQQQQALPPRMQAPERVPTPPAARMQAPPAALAQQQSAWGTASAAMPSGPMLPHMVGMAVPVAPGGGQAPRPMQRMQPAAMAAPQPQQQQLPPPPGAGGGGDEMRQRWMETFNSMGPGQGPGQGPMVAAALLRPMHRAPAAAQAEQQAGSKRKASDGSKGDGRYKQARYDQQRPPPQQQQQQAPGLALGPPGGNGQDAVARLYEATERQQARLQWQCSQQPDGSWRAAAYVGTWPADFPPPSEPPAGLAAGPTQHGAMQAAAAAALLRLNAPPGGAGRGGMPAAPQQQLQQQYGMAQPAPYAAAAGGGGGGGGVTSRNAIDTLIGHFPAATNRIEWQEQPQGPDGSWRYRLVINGGEFEAVGSGPPGPRGEKRALQNAALLVLQAAGYSVTFENPGAPPGAGPAGGGFPGRGGAPAGGRAGGRGGRAGGGGPPQTRGERYAGRSLDSRHAAAAAAAQQQQGMSRDAYLASLHDELA